MNFGELKATLRDILNRKDVTDAQAAKWINSAVSRAGLQLRLPPSEKEVSLVVSGEATSLVPVPADYMELKSITVDDKLPLQAVSHWELQEAKTRYIEGDPKVFLRKLNNFHVWPKVPVGSTVNIWYYADPLQFVSDSDETVLSVIHPYLFVWGGLVLAGHWADDTRRGEWQENFDRTMSELEASAIQEAFSGGELVIRSAYSTD